VKQFLGLQTTPSYHRAMSRAQTIIELLGHGDAATAALAAPGRTPLSYAELRDQVELNLGALRDFGIGRNDPVAIVLPNGPEMASAFLSIAAAAIAAPLNPAYRADEFRFYLSDLGARLLVVQEGVDSAALDVARELNIPVAHLRPDPNGPAGLFDLIGQPAEQAPEAPAQGNDIALVLHTSGTTARPKIVPLTQANLCASAANISESLALNNSDLCLNVMPLFHIHGLIAALLSSLHAGSGINCTPGFNALQFFSQLRETEPTWYTAVPTMHQAILTRAARNRDIIDSANLRLIRSSSASLPAPVMAELEDVFSVPVVEAYGMTEASHQIASNPLPPGERKPGSVGLAAGPEIAVMNDDGDIQPDGTVGEIVIRGTNITAGYLKNPEANSAAYTDGWFRTGDQGFIDQDRYLHLTGRLKEIINRGGEKISPREVDDILLEHPAVAQAVTFAIPHKTLGEDVAAAVVLDESASADESDIRQFVARHLAQMKVPRKIIFLEEIPKGATGKVQRIGLAEKLGLG
jgi:acyl-CoA synthetase (AMP-forming)/AMP-acid ligase II